LSGGGATSLFSVDPQAAEEDVHAALEEAVEERLGVVREEFKLNMACFSE